MTDILKPAQGEIPIACNLDLAQQNMRGNEIAQIFQAYEQSEELDDGYAFRYPITPLWVSTLVNFIMTERECCPFFNFELAFEAGQDAVWLRLRGTAGVKEFIAAQLISLRTTI